MKIGYKVLSNDLSSVAQRLAISISDYKDCIMKYSLTKVNRRRKGYGPLGVFDDIKRAKTWKGIMSNAHTHNFRIFKVVYNPSKDNYFWTPTHSKISTVKDTCYADDMMLLEEIR